LAFSFFGFANPFDGFQSDISTKVFNETSILLAFTVMRAYNGAFPFFTLFMRRIK